MSSISISLVESQLPPGFRFHPTDDELICDYLLHKINGSDSLLLIEVDLNHCEPWDLPEKASVGGKEWYFYSQKDRKYATGIRTNRATASGYWKATGKDRAVVKKDKVVGMRKTLVFYRGRAPKGKKTDWVMHEFRVESPLSSSQLSPLKEDWVLCRVFHKDKEASERPNSNNNYDDTLMDSYITFDQTQPNAKQVPCFSIFSHNQTNLFFPFTHHHPIFTKSYLNTNSNNIIQHGSPTSESYLSELGMPNFWNTNAF